MDPVGVVGGLFVANFNSLAASDVPPLTTSSHKRRNSQLLMKRHCRETNRKIRNTPGKAHEGISDELIQTGRQFYFCLFSCYLKVQLLLVSLCGVKQTQTQVPHAWAEETSIDLSAIVCFTVCTKGQGHGHVFWPKSRPASCHPPARNSPTLTRSFA